MMILVDGAQGQHQPKSSAIQPSPDLGLKPMVNLHPSSILVRGSPL